MRRRPVSAVLAVVLTALLAFSPTDPLVAHAVESATVDETSIDAGVDGSSAEATPEGDHDPAPQPTEEPTPDTTPAPEENSPPVDDEAEVDAVDDSVTGGEEQRAPTPTSGVITSASGAAIGPAPPLSSPSSHGTGAAPAPAERRVLQNLHTDAVATFADGGLTLGTKADVSEGNGTRLNPSTLWFNISADAAQAVPAGYEFIAALGSTVWIAPETNPSGSELWPGFSTESVDAGVLEADQTTFRLTGFSGPGEFELYRGAGSSLERLWSTNDGIAAFTIGRTHMHANWAFTAAGTYRLQVQASAIRDGSPVSSTAVYTFVVGDLPETVATTTVLNAQPSTVASGESVTLEASVTPASVSGYLEFRDGATALWHTPVVDGAATYATTELGIGTRSLSAVFVPAVSNVAAGSASAPVVVTVTDDSGDVFAVRGVANPYQPGDMLAVSLGGYTLAEGETVRWRLRPVGSDTVNGSTLTTAASLEYSRVIDLSWHGFEISAQVRRGTTVVSTTDWVPIVVDFPTDDPLAVTLVDAPNPFYAGDDALLEYSGVGSLDADETLQLARRTETGRWIVLNPGVGTMPIEFLDGNRIAVPFRLGVTSGPFQFVMQVVSGGVVERQSEPMTLMVNAYETQLEGLRSAYRDGQTLRLTAVTYPVRDGADVSIEWSYARPGHSAIAPTAVGGDPWTIEIPLTLADDGGNLNAWVFNNGSVVSYNRVTINVAEDTGEQLFILENLSAHYHQGDTVNLRVTSDPELEPDDTIAWEWLWPGADDWAPVPSAEGSAHTLVAEQALHGVQVRATLHPADESQPSLVTEPRTIGVDDHGAAPRQRLNITGDDSVAEGDTVELTAELAAASVLDTYRWERQRVGDESFTPIAGVTGDRLTLFASAADNGAQYRVSLVTPAGSVGYGPSPALELDVALATEFGIVGVQPSYQPGDVLSATIVGHTLGTGETFRWSIRPIGSTSVGATLQTSASATLSLPLSISDNGYEISAAVRQGTTNVSATAWHTITVDESSVSPLGITSTIDDEPIYAGDFVDFAATNAQLADGESVQWVYRTASGRWTALVTNAGWAVQHPTPEQLRVAQNFGNQEIQYAARIVSNGVAVRQSPSVALLTHAFETMLEGVRPVYRDGDELRITGSIYPDRSGDDVTIRWILRKSGLPNIVLHESTGAASSTVVDTVRTSSHDGAVLAMQLLRNNTVLATKTTTLLVTNQLDGQIFQLGTLAGHYHQGNLVRLSIAADPLPDVGDEIVWEWAWPESDEWVEMSAASGINVELVAEQALDGVRVRATLVPADGEATPITAGPVTIHVDDHGAAPRQQLSITGDTEVASGDDLALTAAVSTASVLDTYRWERQRSGEAEFTVLEGETAASLSTQASLLDDGASYRVSLVTPAGLVAYGPSPAVTLAVSAPPPSTGAGVRPIALTKGHIDFFEVTYSSELGGLVLNIKDDTQLYGPGAQYRDPSTVTMFIDSGRAALDTSGFPPAYAFLQGTSTVYFLPQSQDHNLPWPGWSTERLMSSMPDGMQISTAADSVRFTVDVSGPGNVFTWQTSAFGNPMNQYIDTTTAAPDVIPAGRNVHVHTNWAFSELGTYTFTVTPSATTTTGAQLSGASAVYRVHVGPASDAAPAAVTAPLIVGSGGVGETLHADLGAWLPNPHAIESQWMRDGEPIAGATGATFTPTWDDLDAELSLRVTARVGDATTVATSELVTVVAGTAPAEPDNEPVATESLTADARGDVTLLTTGTIYPGSVIELMVGAEHSTEWVSLWLHSEPTWLGWAQVAADGSVRTALPTNAAPGPHRIAAKSHDGDLIGWAPLTVVPAPAPPPNDDPVVPGGPSNQCIGSATVISSGHVDYATRIINGRLQSLIGDDTTGSKVYREPSGVVLWLKPSSAVQLPSGFEQVGPAGSTVWQVPQTQNANLVWLGWSTESLNASNAASPVTWRLDRVAGPGKVTVFTTGSFGGIQQIIFNGAGSQHTVPIGVHVHANWAFSAQGVYRMTFTQTVTLPNGTRSSDTETVTIAVGNVDPASAAAGGSGCASISNALLSADADTVIDELEQQEVDGIEKLDSVAEARDDDAEASGLLGALSTGAVPVLIAVLAGLLLVGLTGLGLILWRRRVAAG